MGFRTRLWVLAPLPLAIAAACSPASTGTDADAGPVAPTATTPPPPPLPDASALDSSRPDATSADGSPSDAGADVDPSDAGADVDPGDAGADGADSASGPPPAEVVADIPGLTEIDLNATHLLYRTGTTALRSCELPACANDRSIVTLTAAYNQLAASDSSFFFFRVSAPNQHTLHSTNPDGTGLTNHPVVWTGSIEPTGLVGLLSHELAFYRLRPPLGGTVQTQTRRVSSASSRVPRTAQIALEHENFGSTISGGPTPTVTGATLPALTGTTNVVGTSPRGASVVYPMAVVRQGSEIRACPTATDCAAWIDLGPIGPVFNLDGTHLYLGGSGGLSRCALAEIATARTCTPVKIASEPVDPQLYLTATHAYFKSGTKFLRVAK